MDHAYYIPIVQSIAKLCESGKCIIIAIDGRCASGKSMLADRLSEVFNCNVFHMDDFYLPFQLRTKERLSQPGGNIDYERFLKEVLKPLSEGRVVSYQAFDCATGTLKPPIYKSTGALSVVEGSYSLHPSLINQYDYRIFMTCSSEVQKQRLSNREEKERLEQFLINWIPREEYYFSCYSVKDHCDLEIDTSDFFIP